MTTLASTLRPLGIPHTALRFDSLNLADQSVPPTLDDTNAPYLLRRAVLDVLTYRVEGEV